MHNFDLTLSTRHQNEKTKQPNQELPHLNRLRALAGYYAKFWKNMQILDVQKLLQLKKRFAAFSLGFPQALQVIKTE